MYNAVVKGEITTIMVMAKADEKGTIQKDANITNPGNLGNIVWFSTTSDSDDIIFDASDVSGKGVTVYGVSPIVYGVKKGSSDEVTVGTMKENGKDKDGNVILAKQDGKVMSLASDVKVYNIDTDGNITAIAVADIKTDSSVTVVYTVEEGEITNLFIQATED